MTQMILTLINDYLPMIHEFEKLKFQNVYGLLTAIHSNKLYSSAVSNYNTYYGNIGPTENLIITLRLIDDSNGIKKLIGGLLNENGELIKKNDAKILIIERLVSKNHKFSSYIAEFFEYFKLHNGKYLYTPSKAKRLQQSGLRNFLYDLGVVELQQNNQTYQLNIDRALMLREPFNISNLSPEVFNFLQNIKKEIGDKAELCVMNYEQRRLQNSKLLNMLEHIALENVNAGYDILSWENTTDVSKKVPRYIEVKAVPAGSKRFFWSSNEIKIAKKYGEMYCLYLVPRVKDKFLIDEVQIIRNPSIEVFECGEWVHKIENYSIWLNT